MMNKNGFTLIELLGCIALLGIVLVIGLYASHGTLATSLYQLRSVSDNEVFKSARLYFQEFNLKYHDGYTCVKVQDLIDYGYLDNTNDESVKHRIVKVFCDEGTKTITNIEYDDNCSE